jgi:hypothetical protein
VDTPIRPHIGEIRAEGIGIDITFKRGVLLQMYSPLILSFIQAVMLAMVTVVPKVYEECLESFVHYATHRSGPTRLHLSLVRAELNRVGYLVVYNRLYPHR